MAEPDVNLIDWMTDITSDPAKIIEPSSEKQIDGWNPTEAPAAQHFNFFWHSTGRWLAWIKALVYADIYSVDVGGNALYDNLEDAVAALPVGGGIVELRSDYTLTTDLSLPDGTVLRGRGFKTKLTLSGSGKLRPQGNCMLKDFHLFTALTSGIMLETQGDYNHLYHMKFEVPSGGTTECVKWSSDGNHVGASIFKGVATPSTGVGINDTGADNSEADNVYET
jgi:hypothetical protein